MKILLLHPTFKKYKLTEPLGLGYIAAYLRINGFTVDIFDPRINDMDLNQTLEALRVNISDYFLIGLTCCDYYHDEIKTAIDGLRDIGFNRHITLGGYGPTTNYNKFSLLGADSVIIGEGERTFFELAVSTKSGADWRKIHGIAYIDDDGNVIRTKERSLIDNLDELPFPARDVFFSFSHKFGSKYISPQIQGSRGCYMKCAFCSTPDFLRCQGGKAYRLRSVKNIADELELLYSSYGLKDFEFVDDNFFPPNKEEALHRAEELLKEIKSRKMDITFFMQFRPEYVSKPLLKLLKQAGMTRLFMGLESFNDEDLKLYSRSYNSKELKKAIKIIQKSGYSTNLTAKYRFRYGYINFNPLSTIAGLKNAGIQFRKYGFTYKKLGKKLEMFDNNRKIYGKIIEQFPEFSEENQFLHKEVECFYHYISEYFKKYSIERDKYRVVEKALIKGKHSRLDLARLSFLRRAMDRRAYYCYMVGLKLVSSDGAKDSLEDFFSKEQRRLENHIQRWKGKLDNVFDKIGLERNNNDLFF